MGWRLCPGVGLGLKIVFFHAASRRVASVTGTEKPRAYTLIPPKNSRFAIHAPLIRLPIRLCKVEMLEDKKETQKPHPKP